MCVPPIAVEETVAAELVAVAMLDILDIFILNKFTVMRRGM
jgi:hypothetical protein